MESSVLQTVIPITETYTSYWQETEGSAYDSTSTGGTATYSGGGGSFTDTSTGDSDVHSSSAASTPLAAAPAPSATLNATIVPSNPPPPAGPASSDAPWTHAAAGTPGSATAAGDGVGMTTIGVGATKPVASATDGWQAGPAQTAGVPAAAASGGSVQWNDGSRRSRARSVWETVAMVVVSTVAMLTCGASTDLA